MAEQIGNPVDNALAEYAELEDQLADPSVHADQGRARELGRRYAELGPLVAAIREQQQVQVTVVSTYVGWMSAFMVVLLGISGRRVALVVLT